MTELERFKQRVVEICGESELTTEYLAGVTDHIVWTGMTDDEIARYFRAFCEEVEL